MTYTNRMAEITAKAEKKQRALIIETVKANERKVVNQIKHLITTTFTDTVYAKALNNVDINEIGIDYACLEDVIMDIELGDKTDCLVYAHIEVENGVKAIVNAWVSVGDDMHFRDGDFRISNSEFDIDNDGLNPRSNTFVADCLDTLADIVRNENFAEED